MTVVRPPYVGLNDVTCLRQYPPEILVKPEVFMTLWNDPKRYPFASVSKPGEGHGSDGHPVGHFGCTAPEGVACAWGWILKLNGIMGNHDQFFVVRHYDVLKQAWAATWPD